MLELDKRLSMIASLVRSGYVLADIGTDHAYLPCELVKNKIIPQAVAADIADGPLQNAEKTVRNYGLSDRIECRKSNGLSAFFPNECREIVIAGMGGNLIADILTAAEWIRSSDMHLILQPMTHSEDVRKFLLEQGFSIEKESAVIDGRKTYIAISAFYVGQKNDRSIDWFSVYFGLHPQNGTQASDSFVIRQKNRLIKKLTGQEMSGQQDSTEAELLRKVLGDERLKGYKQ